jgi:hypothetical protein
VAAFGNNFLTKFEAAEVPAAILRNITLIDSPGILSGEKQRLGRDYDYQVRGCVRSVLQGGLIRTDREGGAGMVARVAVLCCDFCVCVAFFPRTKTNCWHQTERGTYVLAPRW